MSKPNPVNPDPKRGLVRRLIAWVKELKTLIVEIGRAAKALSATMTQIVLTSVGLATIVREYYDPAAGLIRGLVTLVTGA